MEYGEKLSNKSRTWIAALHLPPALVAAYGGWFEAVNVLFVTLNVLLLWSMYRYSDNAKIGPQLAAHGCLIAALVGIPYSYYSPRSYIDTNVVGTFNILQAAKDNKISRIINTSTSEVYGSGKKIPITES